ncbi:MULTISPECIES: DUF4382 domain-containing protein [Anaeromyxobacter]|uniref:DUF4382 domain-containing protein n=1 Tax=Anaeromyxobacter TaxID=161492 RepID=UPI001F59B90A|nr:MULTISPECIES: DUF4382 domain-containing protein [unclassified Anaeromyxobacter]
MSSRKFWKLGVVAALVSALSACGSSSGSGAVRVRLVDAPGDYQALDLEVRRVEIHADGGDWIVLGTPDAQVDLLSLTGGVSATLVDGATIPAGRYTQLRLVLGPRNTVTLADGSVHDLTVPSGQQSGVKLTVNFEVAPNTTRDVVVDLDAHRSVFVHETGASEKFILRPTVRAVDVLATGAVEGKLTDAASGAGLPGVLVTAQALSATGQPSIVRAALTGADGTYVLDLLDAGGTYYVVSQPVVGAAAYAPRASGAIAITGPTAVVAWDAAFEQASQVGTLSGGISPAASVSQADEVEVRQSLDAGGSPRELIVRTAPGAVAGGVESYSVSSLPAAAYTVLASRRTVDADGNETVTVSAPVSASVPAAGTATADLVLP